MPGTFWKTYSLCLLFFLNSVGGRVSAETPAALPSKIELVTWNIPLMVENKDKGLFLDLVQEISRRTKKEIKVSVHSAGQALMDFSNNKFHGYFPCHNFTLAKEAISTRPFYVKKDFIFYRKGRPLKSVKDLEGRKVGLTFRYFYDPEITTNKKIRIEYADDDFLNMKKLGEGEIDAFIVEERSGLKVMQESGYTNIDFDKNTPLSIKSIYFAFTDSASGQALRDLFNGALDQMQKDGSLDRLFTVKK